MFSMWLSELAQRSGLPVPTIKYYLREGLLPAGELTGRTRARYDEVHLRRLRLIRALVEVAGLRLDAVREILAAVDDPDRPLHEVIGTAHTKLATTSGTPSGTGPSVPAPDPSASRRADDFIARQRWSIATSSAHRASLARALGALSSVDQEIGDDLLDEYAAALGSVAAREVAAVHGHDAATATERAVVGTLLLEPVLLAVRRLAQEDASARLPRRRPRRAPPARG